MLCCFVIAVDTEWYKKLPPITVGGLPYRVERLEARVDSFQGEVGNPLGIPTPTPLPIGQYGVSKYGAAMYGSP